MFENIMKFLRKIVKKEDTSSNSRETAKERLHLVLMQDRANVSADFLELMKQEIIDVIKKYIDVDERAIDVRLTNKENDDGTNGAPALYANIPILNIKEETRKLDQELAKGKQENKPEESKIQESKLEEKIEEQEKKPEEKASEEEKEVKTEIESEEKQDEPVDKQEEKQENEQVESEEKKENQ